MPQRGRPSMTLPRLCFGPHPCPSPSLPAAFLPLCRLLPSSQMDNVGQNLGTFQVGPPHLEAHSQVRHRAGGTTRPQQVLIQPSCSSQHLLPTPTASSGKPRWAGLSKALLGGPETTLPMDACVACPVLPFLCFLTWFKSLKLSKPQCPLL